MITPEQINLYNKYSIDKIYAMESLFRVRDMMNREVIPLVLTINQKNLMNGVLNYKFNAVKKTRFLGSDTVLAAWIAIRFAFDYDPSNPDIIVYCSTSLSSSNEFVSKVKFFLSQIPDWAWSNKNIYRRESRNELVLNNNCCIKAISTSTDGLRGYGFNHLIMDDAAYLNYGSEMYRASLTSLGVDGKATIISRPNGIDSIFEPIYSNAEKMINNFNSINMHWAHDPRFNEEMVWTKDGYSVDEYDYTQKSITQKLAYDWKPTSKWSIKMTREYNYYDLILEQELYGNFVDYRPR